MKKIALEEHFLTPELIDHWRSTQINISPELGDKALTGLVDFGEQRLETMAANGIDHAVLSIAGPGVQIETDAARAVRLARDANDILATEMQKQPKRYGGLADLALQDPVGAATELERCVKDLGFSGAMINGQTLGEYLDADKFSPLWERAAALQAPIYIHPANPIDRPAMYADHSELFGPVWSWGVETATHALRLIFAGVFERYPGASLILGHMGEALPFQFWRIDGRWEDRQQGRPFAPEAAVPLFQEQPPGHDIRGLVMGAAGLRDRRTRGRTCDVLGRLSVRRHARGGSFHRRGAACRRGSQQDRLHQRQALAPP